MGQAFAEFTDELGFSVNALYKNMITDIVGTTHLVSVNARFTRDAVWSVGILASLDLLLKNYPEPDVAARIVQSLFKAVDMDEAQVRAEAKALNEWAAGKTKEELEAALSGEGDSPLAKIAIAVKGDEFWMYSRFFGLGLVKLMEAAGIEMDKDEVYPIMENWMSKKLGKSYLTACVSRWCVCVFSFVDVACCCCCVCMYTSILTPHPPTPFIHTQSDSDMFFKVKSKLDMMETMMKEIEIREKKRMAERLERKAEEAISAAEREAEWAKEVAEEKAKDAAAKVA